MRHKDVVLEDLHIIASPYPVPRMVEPSKEIELCADWDRKRGIGTTGKDFKEINPHEGSTRQVERHMHCPGRKNRKGRVDERPFGIRPTIVPCVSERKRHGPVTRIRRDNRSRDITW